MTFDEWKTKEYPNGCIIPVEYGKGAEISQFLKDAFEAGQKNSETQTKELKEDIEARKFAMAMSEKVEKQLREQIEKMKCCENCKHGHRKYEDMICDFVDSESFYTDYCSIGYNTENNDKWEMKE